MLIALEGSPNILGTTLLLSLFDKHYLVKLFQLNKTVLFQEGWPQNALQLASVLLCASKSVSGSASGSGLATPAQFVDQVFYSLYFHCTFHFSVFCKPANDFCQ